MNEENNKCVDKENNKCVDNENNRKLILMEMLLLQLYCPKPAFFRPAYNSKGKTTELFASI